MAKRKSWLKEPEGNHKEQKQVLAPPSQGRCSLVTPIRIALQNILLATDFSSCSEAALSYAIGMSRRYGATLYTVSVVPPEISHDVYPPDPYHLRHSAENKMANLVKSDLFQGIKHHELVKEGLVSEVLSALIGRLEIDLIVLGTRGRGGIKKLVLGSVAEEIADAAYCPVLTVGPHISRKLGPELKLRRILYATDLLPSSARALTYALWLVEHGHAHLTLLHVLKMPTDVPRGSREAERDTAMKRLKQLLPPETTLSVETEFIVEIGAPAEHILKVAEDQRADLIVMGPHRTSHPGVSAHLPWVTLHQVLCHARCPVLTVRD
jgi:nucleotide-binding universal stress UspA family protein